MGVLNDWEKVATDAELSELKKSVSDGKKSVAEAITDKGIITATDAAFATMADNISQISTLATETADATATAAQILSGKRAYVKGSPVVGTMPNNGGVSAAISNGSLKAGYTTGGDIANLTAGNIKQGINIGGIVGNVEVQAIFTTQLTVDTIHLSNTESTTKTYTDPIKWIAQGDTMSNHVLSVALIDQKQLLTRNTAPQGQQHAYLTKVVNINPLNFAMYAYPEGTALGVTLSADRKTVTLTKANRMCACIGF